MLMLAGFAPPRPRSIEELIGPDLAARLDRLDLFSRKVLAGKLPGERRSKRRGQSIEFDDFREYASGDDLRHIDWNAFARLDRLFVKLFRAEEDLALNLVVDASRSMDVGTPNKLVYASRLAMALAYVGLVNQNRVSLSLVGHPGDSSGVRPLSPLRGRPGVALAGAFLINALSAHAPVAEGTAPAPEAVFSAGMRRLSMARAPRGIMVVISDFLFDAEEGLNYLAPGSALGTLDVFCVQTLAPGELDPAVESARGLVGDLRLTDIETGAAAEVTITPDAVARYRANLDAHTARLRTACFQRGIAFVPVSTAVPVEQLVTNTLRKGGLLR